MGTLGYLAPEVLGLKRYSRQSDMFGLGGLMYYCATLSPPKGLVAPRDVTAWCEATQKALSAGTGVCANASVDLRQAIGTQGWFERGGRARYGGIRYGFRRARSRLYRSQILQVSTKYSLGSILESS